VREAVAVSLYRSGKVPLGRAVELAGLPSRWEAMALLKRHGAWLDLRADDMAEDADTLARLLGP
jgi:predicted HTH domain antitoxin